MWPSTLGWIGALFRTWKTELEYVLYAKDALFLFSVYYSTCISNDREQNVREDSRLYLSKLLKSLSSQPAQAQESEYWLNGVSIPVFCYQYSDQDFGTKLGQTQELDRLFAYGQLSAGYFLRSDYVTAVCQSSPIFSVSGFGLGVARPFGFFAFRSSNIRPPEIHSSTLDDAPQDPL